MRIEPSVSVGDQISSSLGSCNPEPRPAIKAAPFRAGVRIRPPFGLDYGRKSNPSRFQSPSCHRRWNPSRCISAQEISPAVVRFRRRAAIHETSQNLSGDVSPANACQIDGQIMRRECYPHPMDLLYGDDWLSKLPDDILLNIVDRLDVVDVARFSILSRRWKQIPAMLSRVVITVDSFERRCQGSNKKIPFYDAVRLNSTMIDTTRSMLGRRSPKLYTIRVLRMKFYLGDDSISIGQTVANTMATQNVGFAEFTIMTRKNSTICTDEDQVNYGRQFVSFVYTCPNAFNGLASLKLQNLRLSDFSDFPQIFSICKRLEFLRLEYCDSGMLSFLELEHPQISELEIVDCNFEMVDLKWLPKLTLLTFSGWCSLHDPLSFGHVPLLQNVNISNVGLSWHKKLKLSRLLGESTINDLHLNFKSEKIWVVPEAPRVLRRVFHKLQILELINISEDCDLAWIMFIVQGAPYLKDLCVRVWDHLCDIVGDEGVRKKFAFSEEKKDKGLEWDTSASNFTHHNLNVLRIFGFQTEVKFISFIRNVMEVAVNLENIYLYNKPVCKTCYHMVGKPSKYPGSWKQKNSLRSKLSKGLCSAAEIYFPHKITC